jgi:proteasome lid subunit RPN8/RPN11
MDVAIASGLLRQILDHTERARDVEVCGLLLGEGECITAVMPADNLSTDPHDSFELDPRVQFAAYRAARAGGPAVIGHYHSHPNGRTDPSPRDGEAAAAGELWMIVAGGSARLYRARARGRFDAVRLLVN